MVLLFFSYPARAPLETLVFARNEGWASFWASMVFNRRHDAGEGIFTYYKEVLEHENEPPVLPPYPVELASYPRWMESHFDGGQYDKGVEWDWIVFFWGLWTGGIEAGEIADLLRDTGERGIWPDMVREARQKWESDEPDKVDTLRRVGILAGVNQEPLSP